jgi:hypothetical protein
MDDQISVFIRQGSDCDELKLVKNCPKAHAGAKDEDTRHVPAGG